MKVLYLLSCCLLLTLFSCKEKTYIYEVNEVSVSPNNSEKDKEKSIPQFISILYANMYQEALSPDQLVEISELIASIGDKQLAYELVLSKFLTDPDVQIPSECRNAGRCRKFRRGYLQTLLRPGAFGSGESFFCELH